MHEEVYARGPLYKRAIGERLLFIREWASAPLKIAAIAPSGRALSRLITSEICEATGPVLELGPGTGVFTRSLIQKNIPENRIALVELNPRFAARLKMLYPAAQVYCRSAADLPEMPMFDHGVGSVVSGLGLLSMPQDIVTRILSGAFRHLRAGGCFYQFTYGPKCPVPRTIMDELGLSSQRIGWTPLNLPPASVYRIKMTR